MNPCQIAFASSYSRCLAFCAYLPKCMERNLLEVAAVLFALAVAGPALAWQNLPANGLFLIAKPAMADPNFAKTVVLVTQNEDSSTVGVIINRPGTLKLPEFLSPELSGNYKLPIYIGGPVMPQTLLAVYRSETAPAARALHVLKNIYLTMHADNIKQLLTTPDAQYRLYAGLSSWAPLQLKSEFMRSSWYVMQADEATLFRENTEGLWEELVIQASQRHSQSNMY